MKLKIGFRSGRTIALDASETEDVPIDEFLCEAEAEGFVRIALKPDGWTVIALADVLYISTEDVQEWMQS